MRSDPVNENNKKEVLKHSRKHRPGAAMIVAILICGITLTALTTINTVAKNGQSGSMNGTVSTQNGDNHKQTSLEKNTLDQPCVIYEAVEMRRYEGKDGHSYVHDIRTNGTTRKIMETQYGMLAFDKDGNPLKIDWFSLDTDLDSEYFYLNSKDSTKTPPGETQDDFGGWSLNFFGEDKEAGKIAYVLYCDKEIVFEDGTVWKNPEFEKWRSDFEGKKTDVSVLESYYPYVQSIGF